MLTEGGITFLPWQERDIWSGCCMEKWGGDVVVCRLSSGSFFNSAVLQANPCWVWRSLLHLQRTAFYLWLPRGPASWREYRDEKKKEASSPHKEMGVYTYMCTWTQWHTQNRKTKHNKQFYEKLSQQTLCDLYVINIMHPIPSCKVVIPSATTSCCNQAQHTEMSGSTDTICYNLYTTVDICVAIIRQDYFYWISQVKIFIFIKQSHHHHHSPSDPLGHGLSTVSPLCVAGHCTPRATLDSHTWSSGPCGGTRRGLRVTGTVAVIGRRSGALLMAPIGWAVGGRGRMVEGMELEVTGLAAVVVLLLIWVEMSGPESKREGQTGMQRKWKPRQQEHKRQRSRFRTYSVSENVGGCLMKMKKEDKTEERKT